MARGCPTAKAIREWHQREGGFPATRAQLWDWNCGIGSSSSLWESAAASKAESKDLKLAEENIKTECANQII